MELTSDPIAAPRGFAGFRRRRERARKYAAGFALVALIAAGACTSAKQREDPSNIFGALRFRGAETRAHFEHNYRSGNLYHDFRPIMIADAIFQDERYRTLFLRTLRDRYFVGAGDLDKMVREQQDHFDQYFEFLVFLYGGSNVPVRLNEPESNWKLLLRDDDGDVLAPISMQGIKADSATYRYIGNYFAGLDRWTQAYIVRFPKLEKRLAGEKIGAHPIELLVTGLEGTLTMRWDDPNLFYRSEGGIQLAKAGSGANGRNGSGEPGVTPEGDQAGAAPPAR